MPGQSSPSSRGICAGKLVALVLTGMGRARAQRGAEVLLAGHRPRWIISAGFGGALDPSLKRNDVVLAARGRQSRRPDRFAIDLAIPPEAEAQGLKTGRLVTVNEIVRKASDKAELRQRPGPTSLTWRPRAVAALCEERGVKFLSVRAISDEAGVDLPPEILAIVGPTGGVRIGATIGALWKRPSSVKDLLGLRQHATEAAERLAAFLVGTFPRLP